MKTHTLALIGAVLIGATDVSTALAQSYVTVPTYPSNTAEKDAENRRKIIAARKRIAAREASRASSVHLNTAGGASTSTNALASNGGLPTSGLSRRSIPITQSRNRSQLVAQ